MFLLVARSLASSSKIPGVVSSKSDPSWHTCPSLKKYHIANMASLTKSTLQSGPTQTSNFMFAKTIVILLILLLL